MSVPKFGEQLDLFPEAIDATKRAGGAITSCAYCIAGRATYGLQLNGGAICWACWRAQFPDLSKAPCTCSALGACYNCR